MRQARLIAYLCPKKLGSIDITGLENPPAAINTSVNVLDPEKPIEFKYENEIIGTGDGSSLSPTLAHLDHGKNGICLQTVLLPFVYATCKGRKRLVVIDKDGNCSGYCTVGKLGMLNGEWATNISWVSTPDAGKNITITYYESYYSYSGRALIMPDKNVPGCKDNVGKIAVKLLKETDNAYECKPGFDQLKWWRGQHKQVVPTDPIDLYSWINFVFQNPESCHWLMTDITVFGAGGEVFHGRSFVTIFVGSGGQACPEKKEDVFGGGKTSSHEMIQNQVVPGERIRLEWLFSNTEIQEKPLVDEKWFFTHCFTGGKVTAVNGSYGDPNITYSVELEGLEKECVPSDFVEYAVSDWVFVAKMAGLCEICEERSGVCCSYAGAITPYVGAQLLLAFVNRARSDIGLDSLTLNSSLYRAAFRHAKDMADNEFCKHTGSDGSTPCERIAATGYLAGAGPWGYGENIACGQTSVGLVFSAWMDSTKQKANILNPLFKNMGLEHRIHVEEMILTYDEWGNRIVTATRETDYWCQTFGYNDSPPPTPISEYVILPVKIAGYGP